MTKDLPLILPTLRHPFQWDSLRMAGIQTDRIVQVPPSNEDLTVDRLFFSESLGSTSNPMAKAIDWLRQTYPPSMGRKGRSRRLYISRRDAPSRKVSNETEVAEFLTREGFEIVCPGAMTFAQQIELFREASIVVAAHGAGATNMIFAPPGATLIEFFGGNYVNGCYWAISNLCDHKYGVVITPSQTPDYHVPLPRLAAVLKQLSSRPQGTQPVKAPPRPSTFHR